MPSFVMKQIMKTSAFARLKSLIGRANAIKEFKRVVATGVRCHFGNDNTVGVSGIFVWDHTPQGWNFWNDIDEGRVPFEYQKDNKETTKETNKRKRHHNPSDSTTTKAYYFARRKDTGMAGVWYTHCATEAQQEAICASLAAKAELSDALYHCDGVNSKFAVEFLSSNFSKVTKGYCAGRSISIASALTLKTIQEAKGPSSEFIQLP